MPITTGHDPVTGNAYEVNFDNPAFCTSVCAGQGGTKTVNWSIGGDIPNLCCGDDNGEFIKGRLCSSWCTTNSTDDACCDSITDCVNDSKCTPDMECVTGKPAQAYCDGGTWRDSDENIIYCGQCAGNNLWNLGGDDCRPNVEGIQTTCCCTDDPNEVKTDCLVEGTDDFCSLIVDPEKRVACCDNTSDCVYMDNCYVNESILSGRMCVNKVWIDNVPPSVNVITPPANWQNTDATAMISCSDDGSGCDVGSYRLIIYDAPRASCPQVYNDYLELGYASPRTISYHSWICGAARDTKGNAGFSSPVEFKVDKIRPATALDSPSVGSWQTASFNLFFADSDEGGSGLDISACEYRVIDIIRGQTKGWTSRTCSNLEAVIVSVGTGMECSTEGTGTCTVETRSKDFAGNVNTYTWAFSIDTSPPACSIDSLIEVNKPECQFAEGKDHIYYSNSEPNCNTGSFKVNVIGFDPESGIKNVSFSDTVNPGGYDINSPYEYSYSWIHAPPHEFNGSANATCYANSGLSTMATFYVLRDVDPPSGGSIDYPDGFWNQTIVPVVFATVSDSGSGIEAASAHIEKKTVGLSGGSCGNFLSASWIPIEASRGLGPPLITSYPDGDVVSGKCYKYRYIVSDNVLNQGIFENASETRVDLVPPDNPPVTDQGEYSASPSLTFTATYPNSNPLYRPDMESGLSNCYIEIATDPAFTQASIADSGKIITGGGMVGTYTFNGGEDSKTYYARVKCDDQAGNMNFTYSTTDGITVDTSIPQIPVVNDVRGLGQTDDVDTISSTEVAWVYWRAVDTGSPIVREEYSLYEYVQDGSPVSLTGWIQSVPSGATAMGGGYATMDMRTNTGEVNLTKLHQVNPSIPEQMSNGKHYFFKVNVTDSVGHWNVSTSDGFMISACDGQPCGKTCELNNQQGACNGLGVCYIGGGCGLSCSLPAGYRACYDNDNNKLLNCTPFSNNPSAYCKRTGATRCGAGSLCLDSVTNGRCLDPFAGSGGPVDMTGSWTTYQVSDPTKFYGPNNPITVQAGGIGGVPSSFEPLLECTLEAPLPGKYYYLDRWGKMDALLSFRDFPLNSDGQWNLTKCALKTDYDDNKGWDMINDSTIYRFNIDTTKPAASIKGPVGKIGIRFNITWEGVDPVVNGMKSDVDYYYVEYVDKSEVVGNINWQGDETTKIRANYLEVVLPSSKADASTIAVYCFRVKAVDNAGNAGDWSCEPLDSGSPNDRFASCNCAALDTRPPGGIWVSTAPKFSNAPETSISVDWGAVPSGGSGSAMAASGFRTMAVPEGTQCFEVDYRVTDNTGKNLTPGNGWVQWGAINDRHNVPIWEGGSSYRTIDCTTQNNVVFSPRNVIGEDAENRAYFFRVRAVGDISGYAPVSNWTETTEGAKIDRTKPDVDLSAIRRLDGSPIPEGDTILTRESVIINVTGDPLGVDFTGANSSWIVWKKISTSGYSDEGRYYCPAGSATCTTRDPWNVLDGDYNVSYQGFSMDRAGNVGRSTVDSFNARAPLGLVTSIRELYLVLGSFEHATIQISNRQNVNEDISLMLQGDYKYSKFLDVTGGELSLDKRTLNITLLPLETKTATIIVYTGDICEACEMNVTAESRIHDDINSTNRMRINVVFPAEFSGLSTAGLVLLMALAALAYMWFGTRRQE